MPSKNTKPSKIERTCLYCKSAFFARAADVARGNGKFCSKTCAMKSKTGPNAPNWRGGKVERTCERCSATFYRDPNEVKPGRARFCSKACYDEFQKTLIGPKSVQWKGGRWLSPNGYVRMGVPGRGTVTEHRYVMEQHLGRRLRSDEAVHHINGDKTDNRLENLQLMSIAEHQSLHMRQRKE